MPDTDEQQQRLTDFAKWLAAAKPGQSRASHGDSGPGSAEGLNLHVGPPTITYEARYRDLPPGLQKKVARGGRAAAWMEEKV